jgi:hypothetical protein
MLTINTQSYRIQKSVDILFTCINHIAGIKSICADNNPHWITLGILSQ